MSVIVKANPGYDLGYVWKNQGAQPQREKSAGGYYINAAQAGEPPGRWWGPGAEALGFETGQVVEREPYEAVYRQIHPVTGAKMGRSAGNYERWADWLIKLKAAEPHATAGRVLELEREAAQKTRQAPAYTDLTVSFSKSIRTVVRGGSSPWPQRVPGSPVADSRHRRWSSPQAASPRNPR